MYRDAGVIENTNRFKGEFIAQNVRITEDALFEGAHAYDEDTGHAFKPYTNRFVGGRRVAVIGQAFPFP
jgi:sulfur-oxidizing protein SoxB